MTNVQAVSQEKVCKYYNEGHFTKGKGTMGSSDMFVLIVVDKVGTVFTQGVSVSLKPKDRTKTLINRFQVHHFDLVVCHIVRIN